MQNGLCYGRTWSQNGFCVVFIDIFKQNLNILYVSSEAPDLSTIYCKEVGSCNTKNAIHYIVQLTLKLWCAVEL